MGTIVTDIESYGDSKWTRLLRRVEGLSRNSKAFETAQLLCEIFRDKQFRADIGATNDQAAADFLDRHHNFCGFFVLQACLEHFPNESDWRERTVPQLHAALEEKLKADERLARKARSIAALAKPPLNREPVTEIAEGSHVARTTTARKLADERESISRQAENLSSELIRLRTENDLLRKENRELKSEVNRLRSRLRSQLRRSASSNVAHVR